MNAAGTSAAGPTLRRLSVLLLVLTAALPSLPSMYRELTTALAIEPLPYGRRREAVLGAFYTTVRQLKKELPVNSHVALILRRPADIDHAVFANYYLYPRRTRVYFSLRSYREDLGPEKATTILQVDRDHPRVLRSVTYQQLRSEDIAASPVMARAVPREAAARQFLVPFAGSVDGAPPDVYVTEAVITSERTGRVRFRLYPQGKERTVLVRAGQPLRLSDALGELFAATSVGWLQVEAEVPVRTGWWLVNRGIRASTPVPIVLDTGGVAFEVEASEQVWLLNSQETDSSATVGGRVIPLKGRELRAVRVQSSVRVEAPAGVLAFGSRKLRDRTTRFEWPGEVE